MIKGEVPDVQNLGENWWEFPLASALPESRGQVELVQIELTIESIIRNDCQGREDVR